tara:strand:- start:476 stop:1234 length:759 start_codon:yes stop_codon:yes gene_type:complete
MDISNTNITHEKSKSIITDLTDNIEPSKYYLYLIDIHELFNFTNNNNFSSLICINGNLTVNGEEITKYGGFHLHPNVNVAINSKSSSKILIGSTKEINFSDFNFSDKSESKLLPLSTYKVEKPWGFENWYTDNLENPSYALKRIHMEEGFQSSLQSHQFKSETNFVVDGKALVLFGIEAPKNTSTKINIEELDKKIYTPLNGWSNKINELHRVIAHTSYDAIEISTPELDDVIRWQDDNNRISGRIETEHTS